MAETQNNLGRGLPDSQASSAQETILVIGLGNPILGDDGVGWRIADLVKSSLLAEQSQKTGPLSRLKVEVDSLAVGGLSLMERLIGYQRAIIIDAITTGQYPVGSVYNFPLEDLPDRSAGHSSSAHDTSLQTALEVGHSMGAELPEQIMIVGVEAEAVYVFSEELTPPVKAALPEAVRTVMDILIGWAQLE